MHLHAPLTPMGPAAAFILTDAQLAELGPAKTPPVRVTVAGTSVRARVGRMGGQNLVGLSQALRADLSVEIGATYDVEIVADDAPREVEVPDDLAEALAQAKVRAAFDAQSYTLRKEQALGVTGAKKTETRASRIAKIVAALI
jgi:uncharacterized protein YdeI (YjbR/CyaY-like superfamily)